MSEIDHADAPDERSIAIVGIAGRFPGWRYLNDVWGLIT